MGTQPQKTNWQKANPNESRFCSQAFRSHDQCNTTIYAMADRHRDNCRIRKIIVVNVCDIELNGAKPDDLVEAMGPRKND